MKDLNERFKKMYPSLIMRTINLTNERNTEAKTTFEVNYMLLQDFIDLIKSQPPTDGNNRILKILSDKNIKKDFYINHVSTYDENGDMYLSADSIVYIAIKDRKKNDLLCVFALKDDSCLK